MTILRQMLARLVESVWIPILMKGALWVLAFLALAHVGEGAAERLVEPPQPQLGAALAIGARGVVRAARHKRSAARATRARASPCKGGSGGRVVLNQASADQLIRLPGVGKKRARAIIEVREQLGGRFRRVRDLLRVRGIGHRSLKRLEPHLVLDAPAQPKPAKSAKPASR